MARTTPVAQQTTLTYQTSNGAAQTIEIGAAAWYAWLETPDVRRFAFEHSAGRFTARKERKQRGGWYWTAYRQIDGKLRKSYLGKSAELSLARLLTVATTFADPQAQASSPLPPSPAPQSSTTAMPVASTPILMTKLFVPPAPAGLVARPHLTARLTAGLAGQLTLVSAPPGFGKTTLLAEWLAHCARPVAWLTLEAGDSEPLHLLRYLVAALQTITPAIGETVLALLQAPQPPAVQSLLALLINDLATRLPPAILVLDDYHMLQGAPIHAALGFLLEHLPPQLHLVITTREDPPFPLTRLRARRQLNELRAADLRFTVDEAAAFLNKVMNLTLSHAEVAALEERTEGWIAGLQLAALSLREQTDTAAFLATFTGSHRYILDYLAEEVFNRQPLAVQTFLLKTSILDRLCGTLCDAVLADGPTKPAAGERTHLSAAVATFYPASQAMLAQLEQANLFLISLDNERRWYRYHHLFADLLQVRLRQSQPDLLPELHRRASEWLEQAGLTAEAIQHALAIPDHQRAARLIAHSAEPMVVQGDFMTLYHWLNALPAPVLHSHLRLLLMQAWTHFLVEPYGATAVETILREAEAILDVEPPAPTAQNELRGIVAAIRSAVAGNQEDRERAIDLAEAALTLLPAANLFWRIIPTVNLGLAYDAGGAVAVASARFTEAVAMARRAGNAYVTLIAIIHLGRVQVEQGQLHAAVDLYREALMLANQRGWDRLPMVSLPHIWLAKVLYEWNDLASATHHASTGITIVQSNEHPRMLLEAYATLARIRQAEGNFSAAQTLMARAVAVAQAESMQWAAPRVAAYQARAWLTQGQPDRAGQWRQTARLRLDDELSSQREYEHITLARVLIAQDHPAEALPFLQRLAVAAERAGRLRSLLEILVLCAQAYQAQGAMTAALNSLHQALVLAEPEGYIRSFVDEGPSVAALLQKLKLTDKRIQRYKDKLLSALAGEPRQNHDEGATLVRLSRPISPNTSSTNLESTASPSTLIEPLSQREQEVLRLVAAGLSNQEIAQKLIVASTTVKRHLSNIYGKLGVQSRTAAVARAQALGLL